MTDASRNEQETVDQQAIYREFMEAAGGPHNVASFVLRFTQDMWEDTEQEPHVRWRGHIRHVQSEEESRFVDFAHAVAFIQENLNALTASALAGKPNVGQTTVMRETFKLWEQYAASYTDMMVSAMEQTRRQSDLVWQQIEVAREQMRRMWGCSETNVQAQTVDAALENLQQQVEALTARVKQLESSLQAGKGR
ncbi:MAG: hypothetical protein H6642_09215 [Caldilineaceae bacterium]|nr:hypothetical protein [Caldilineaceae bacterium]